MLPLSSDGIVADGILGATEYQTIHLDPDLPIDAVNEMEVWFSLSAAESTASGGAE